MNKKLVQIDDYDIVELWADGECQLRLMWDQERKKIDTLVAGPMSLVADLSVLSPEEIADLKTQEPGIITALKKEKLLDE